MRTQARLTFPLLLENALTSWIIPNYQSWFGKIMGIRGKELQIYSFPISETNF
ncbi:hypothetical protein VB620_00750 [Nodularia harveyana UHCC-0300]|uniref:Uncharacterized protein n=1 Tax=Nodularia harveyana UHCC-0300 TaxID=2974287 RepID=A0ABU5U8K0_9CYAN|nr:hypothetical protein [Nodularia harveyana]MEA5579866.1 hypothetical protein [Nodularia harveyana UHCC-0300]